MAKKTNEERWAEIAEEGWGCATVNPKACRTCALRFGEPPYADSPEKSNCVAYPYESGRMKPDAVYFGGKDCAYYVKG